MKIPVIVAPLLTQLLKDSGPEKAARLKQRLTIAFAERGLGRFDERLYGYFKFKDFLERAFPDLIRIDPQIEGGDISVSLRDPTELAPVKPPKSPVIKNDVWQAFTNPDAHRKRFFNPQNGEVVHFKEGEYDSRASVVLSPGFVEITPISGLSQMAWMTEYLSSLQLPEDERSTLENIPKGSYSSGLNLTFTRALGVRASAWKRFRRDKVFSEVKRWAESNQVNLDSVYLEQRPIAPGVVPHSEPVAPIGVREQAVSLLDLLSEEDISKAVLPTILTTILVRSRL